MMIGGLSAVDIAERFGTPAFVTDERVIRTNYRRIREAFTNHMPTRINYACKANSNLAILRILEHEGSCIDAVSLGEVDTCIRAGFAPNRILYTGVAVSNRELKALVARGVMINIDSISEMRRLANIATGMEVSIRINPAVGSGHHEKVVTGAKGTKFGVPKDQVLSAFSEAVELGLLPVGIHAHTGSGGLATRPFMEVTQVLVAFANEIEEGLGISLNFLDIGGGLGIPYRPEENELDIETLAGEITSIVKENSSIGTFVLEPGRFIVADSTVLLTRVHDLKEAGDRRFLGVDAGFNTLIRPAFYDSYHHVALANKFSRPGEMEYDVVGPICETGDRLAKGRMLPRAEEGDLVAVYDAGAYGFVMSSQYNSRPRCREILVDGDNASLIREAESLEDVLRHQRIPSRLMI